MSCVDTIFIPPCNFFSLFILQHFMKPEDATAALNALDDSEFGGSHIQVQVGTATHLILSLFSPKKPFSLSHKRECFVSVKTFVLMCGV